MSSEVASVGREEGEIVGLVGSGEELVAPVDDADEDDEAEDDEAEDDDDLNAHPGQMKADRSASTMMTATTETTTVSLSCDVPDGADVCDISLILTHAYDPRV